jgi:RNA polymerase sigma-70 factor (ECF subfamily)
LPRKAGVAIVGAVPTDPDVDLIARMARGDEAALSALYDRYAPAAFALALRVTGDRSEGEDVVQAVFLRLWQVAGRFDAERGTVSSWLLTSIRHESIDRIRRRQAHDRAIRRSAPEASTGSEPARDTDTTKRLRAAVQSLPTDQREAVELAYFEGWSQSEIAERLGQPLGTIKTRLRLGMMKLREQLAGQVRMP